MTDMHNVQNLGLKAMLVFSPRRCKRSISGCTLGEGRECGGASQDVMNELQELIISREE